MKLYKLNKVQQPCRPMILIDEYEMRLKIERAIFNFIVKNKEFMMKQIESIDVKNIGAFDNCRIHLLINNIMQEFN